MPDWLRTILLIAGVFVLLVALVIGFVMWRYRIPPRGLLAMGAAAVYLVSPIDVVPELVLGPLGLLDDTGVTVAAALFVYKLVKTQRILRDGGVNLSRPGRRTHQRDGDPT
jgi:uncharacterized membrane protein YkvA (DUF1232 family)